MTLLMALPTIRLTTANVPTCIYYVCVERGRGEGGREGGRKKWKG